MVSAGLEGVDFVVANTDAQALAASQADRRIQMGSKLTEGLGAGSNPEVGRQAAEESMAEIVDMLQGRIWPLSRPVWAEAPEPVRHP